MDYCDFYYTNQHIKTIINTITDFEFNNDFLNDCNMTLSIIIHTIYITITIFISPIL